VFERPQHKIIAAALGSMDSALLLRCGGYFGGGTAIVLQNGEYRLSLDVDFLCADVDGYRELRGIAVAKGAAGFFGAGVETIREMRTDQYGVRAMLSLRGQPIRFEIIRESRIPLSGAIDPVLKVPVLSIASQFAEKLLANADRGLDRSVAYRDAIDLGYLLAAIGAIPAESVALAERAYGDHVQSQIAKVFGALSGDGEIARTVQTLGLDSEAAYAALGRLRVAAKAAWPGLMLAELPLHGHGAAVGL
jgi:hypothetical protein